MSSILRWPTRDAKDADHLALMLFVGGIISFMQSDIAESVQGAFFTMGVVAIITGPLLWLRIPFAKWGGVAASLLMASIPVLRWSEKGFSVGSCLTTGAFLVIAFWYFSINYNHKFDLED